MSLALLFHVLCAPTHNELRTRRPMW